MHKDFIYQKKNQPSQQIKIPIGNKKKKKRKTKEHMYLIFFPSSPKQFLAKPQVTMFSLCEG